MGNCTSGTKKKKKGDSAPDDKEKYIKPTEDVTYASIDHSTAAGSRRTKTTSDDCDYTTVKVPSALLPESQCSSRQDECDDDYVLMG